MDGMPPAEAESTGSEHFWDRNVEFSFACGEFEVSVGHPPSERTPPISSVVQVKQVLK